MDFEIIAPAGLKACMEDPQALILDLRQPEEYKEEHIRGAVNLPYEELMECRMLPMDVALILYCARGSASMAAARELSQRGYLVKTVAGGILACRDCCGELLVHGGKRIDRSRRQAI